MARVPLARSLTLFRSVFQLYAAPRIRAESPGLALHDKAGAVIGMVDRITLENGQLTVTGWSTASSVALTSDRTDRAGGRHQPATGLVAPAAPARQDSFEITLPFDPAPLALTLSLDTHDGPVRHTYPLPPIPRWQLRAQKLRLLPSFALRAAKALPTALTWRRTRSDALKQQLRDLLGLTETDAALRMVDAATLFAQPQAAATPVPITVVLPVYNAFDLTAEALDRIARHTDLDWHLILVEDASTDDRIRPYLRDWAAAPGRAARVELIENPENLGFIGSVNRAFERALELKHHVVLLNSDALVPDGWASRLLAPLLADPTVATVTPMSNDAEILTAPVICAPRPLTAGQGDAIDATARQLAPKAASADLPTGVGFCMAMSIDFLNRIGPFDTAFGKGYGEEVDWCRRASAAGGRHIGLGSLFVEHRGGTSFGSETKQALLRQNGAILSRRYPAFDADVRTFIQTDPLSVPRLVLAVALAAAHHNHAAAPPLPVYLAHSLGGGAEYYLRDRIARDLAEGGFAVVLRVGRPATPWQIELHAPEGTARAASTTFQTAAALLAPAKRRRIVYSCGVGHADPIGIPGHLLSLKETPEDRIEVLFHDYLPISPSYTLLDSNSAFHGVPPEDSTDPARTFPPAGGRGGPPEGWGAAWAPPLAPAGGIAALSQDSKAQITAAWPAVADTIQVRPHTLRDTIPKADHSREIRTLGILGNIGLHKGARVVEALAAQKTGPRLVLIGMLGPEFRARGRLRVHGPYTLPELGALIDRYQIDAWLIPSIWPETFSYTTHEALATGLPTFCFALGAQAEAVAAAPNGHVLTASPDDPKRILSEISAADPRISP
ncbi:glycosyltransferase [Aestuariibius sp. 2305UL40-4]|uniref:glycosyltransferase n=1 Tax=Aestuariibius violaceus TaxID=3234132 RepID=UPI00398F378C